MILSTNYGYKRPFKDRASPLPPLRDKFRAFSDDNKLKGSFITLSLPMDLDKQEPGPLTSSVLKYSK